MAMRELELWQIHQSDGDGDDQVKPTEFCFTNATAADDYRWTNQAHNVVKKTFVLLDSAEDLPDIEKEQKRRQALAKLTKEEQELLGLTSPENEHPITDALRSTRQVAMTLTQSTSQLVIPGAETALRSIFDEWCKTAPKFAPEFEKHRSWAESFAWFAVRDVVSELIAIEARAVLAGAPEPKAKWDDPRVQQVYQILCSNDTPPSEQHWEGWTARRIVDVLCSAAALQSTPAQAQAPEQDGAEAGNTPYDEGQFTINKD